jgi:hypothetical protein
LRLRQGAKQGDPGHKKREVEPIVYREGEKEKARGGLFQSFRQRRKPPTRCPLRACQQINRGLVVLVQIEIQERARRLVNASMSTYLPLATTPTAVATRSLFSICTVLPIGFYPGQYFSAIQ